MGNGAALQIYRAVSLCLDAADSTGAASVLITIRVAVRSLQPIKSVTTEVLIWGAGGHAKVVAEAVRLGNHFKIAGFLDEVNLERWGQEWCGSKILGGKDVLSTFAGSNAFAIVPAVGNTSARFRMIEAAAALGLPLATIIHPNAIISPGATLGPGTVALAGAIVNPGTTTGRAVILNTACSADHDCIIEDGASLAPGARLGGGVRVGRGAWIGIGAVVREGITIGGNAVVGAGTVVIRDVLPDDVVVGNPARFLKRNSSATHSS